METPSKYLLILIFSGINQLIIAICRNNYSFLMYHKFHVINKNSIKNLSYPDTQLLNPHSIHILQPSVIMSLDLHVGHISSS